jgi:predicted nucleotidyltransferase component of viral defense system
MLIPQKRDTLHRAWLFRLLSAIADDRTLLQTLRFKGGTCAAMLGLLNRFSVDLDFDLPGGGENIPLVRSHLETIFSTLGLKIKDSSTVVPQYFLQYDSPSNTRNTIALDITFPPPKSNAYTTVKLEDIDRFLPCQSIPTMVANKLVTPLDRFQKHGSIAGRDIYDIHAFLLQDLPVSFDVIQERTALSPKQFCKKLSTFIDQKVTQTILDQDLNTLLPPKEFQRIRPFLQEETVRLVAELVRKC